MNQILNDASKRAAPGGGGQTAPASRPAEIERLSVFDLVPSEDNFYSMNDIEELKSKIELAGKVLQNFIVVPLGGGKYKVISGKTYSCKKKTINLFCRQHSMKT